MQPRVAQTITAAVRSRRRRFFWSRMAAGALILSAGCVERKLTVLSDPDGALVTLNNQEIGRTPVTRDFLWYGKYDVQARRDGYEAFKKTRTVSAPWWEWVPFDLAADLLPFRFTVQRTIHFTMRPATGEAVDPNELMSRALTFENELNSSGNTRAPTSAPSTKPTSKPIATMPATMPATLPATMP